MGYTQCHGVDHTSQAQFQHGYSAQCQQEFAFVPSAADDYALQEYYQAGAGYQAGPGVQGIHHMAMSGGVPPQNFQVMNAPGGDHSDAYLGERCRQQLLTQLYREQQCLQPTAMPNYPQGGQQQQLLAPCPR